MRIENLKVFWIWSREYDFVGRSIDLVRYLRGIGYKGKYDESE